MAYLSSPTYRTAPRPQSLLQRISRFVAVSRSRSALRNLDAAALRDIGISRDAAQAEAARPFWDAPEIWRD